MLPNVTERKSDGFLYRLETADRASAVARVHDYYEIFRVAQGHFYCSVEGREYSLSPGDIILILPGERHIPVLRSSDGEYALQLIRFEREYLTGKFPDILNVFDKKPVGERSYIPASLASKYAVDIIFSQLHEYSVSDKDEAETVLCLCSLVLVTKISEVLKYEYSSDVTGASGELRLKKNIKKITDYINENITASINLDGIANYLYLDKSYVCRLFKRETGLTINTYINMTRIAMAKQMISDGVLPRDVYTRCGYNDYSTFYRAFRRHAGITPEEFKRGYSDSLSRRRST